MQDEYVDELDLERDAAAMASLKAKEGLRMDTKEQSPQKPKKPALTAREKAAKLQEAFVLWDGDRYFVKRCETTYTVRKIDKTANEYSVSLDSTTCNCKSAVEHGNEGCRHIYIVLLAKEYIKLFRMSKGIHPRNLPESTFGYPVR